MKPMPDMNEFARKCHLASEAKGWTNLKRTDAQTINLMISELSEAVEEFRDKHENNEIYFEVKIRVDDHTEVKKVSDPTVLVALQALDGKMGRGDIFLGAKPCGIPIELADCIIRIGQQCGTHKLELAGAMGNSQWATMKKRTDLNEMIADASLCLGMAWMYSPQSKLVEGDGAKAIGPEMMAVQFAGALWSILYFCEGAKIDIWQAVEDKMAYNETRPMLHGGKAI
jgi:hypothetical protein